MSLRDVTIAWDGKRWLASANDVTHRKRAEDLGNLKKVSWDETCLVGRWLVFTCSRRPLCRCHVCWWGRWKSQNRKIVPLSPYVEEPLNSKVIKGFIPEQRSRKCFSCFEIPIFYLYGHSMYVSHIALSWLWYNDSVTFWFVTETWGINCKQNDNQKMHSELINYYSEKFPVLHRASNIGWQYIHSLASEVEHSGKGI